MTEKLYIVKKYVRAKNVADALRKEKNTPPDAVWSEETDEPAPRAPGFDTGA